MHDLGLAEDRRREPFDFIPALWNEDNEKRAAGLISVSNKTKKTRLLTRINLMNTSEKALALCHAIEAAGASEQLTNCSVLASELLIALQQQEQTRTAEMLKPAPALEITEADIVAFLAEHADRISKATNIGYTSVSCDISRSCGNTASITWRLYADAGHSANSDTLEGAQALLLAELEPQNLAAAKRAAAAKLLEEANKLSPAS